MIGKEIKEKPRLKRLCKGCNKMFMPNGKKNMKCEECKKEVFRELSYKRVMRGILKNE